MPHLPSPPLILASASPRRKELLDRMGLAYQIDVADVDECVDSWEAHPALLLAERKARAVASRHPEARILGADTLVFLGAKALGKPRDEADALAMLLALSGQWHEVRTGLCLLESGTGIVHLHEEATRVHMLPLTRAECLRYIQTGEPMDKAGAYAIQGIGGMYIDRIEGSFSNVIGLPTSVLYRLLHETA